MVYSEADMHLNKEIEHVEYADVVALIDGRVPENETLEFKEGLSGDKREPNTWMAPSWVLSRKSSVGILKHLVAFANTSGGYLLLGIQEDVASGVCAKGIVPVAKCEDLLRRLTDAIADQIEPLASCIRSKVLVTSSDGSGIVIFQVARSSSAPHRLKTTNDCYMRVGASTRQMAMVDIQRATLRTNRQAVEGLWSAKFKLPNLPETGCIIVLEAGRLFGGDSYFYYTGRYEIDEDGKAKAVATIKHYAGVCFDIFGGCERECGVSITGNLSGGEMDCVFSKLNRPQYKANIKLHRREYLP
ncbi:RNA-binding domain-containing protein [Humidesulfovibrio sp.]